MGFAMNTGTNYGLSPDPNTIIQFYGFRNQIKRLFFVVVIPGQKHCSLGKANVAPNLHFCEIIDPNSFSDPK
ncbi:MAG: hypothetical protein GVY02_10390 [Bacteroidetes bacterium]|jgi:hypothetical protein|nr:hypothetical protein [Bacteroidota bacterium]